MLVMQRQPVNTPDHVKCKLQVCEYIVGKQRKQESLRHHVISILRIIEGDRDYQDIRDTDSGSSSH